ncbi:MAG: hypothetical protein K0S23_812 [Fluviicola sp.]|jgi:hypothetical protein|uniref:hypothetical protein n=1 Tax=Fluviicola sp. TaxID=1917219 RepID=UPI002632F88F|nr:hypothetical protein [Fluviicola sp.]MDF3026505.1 hypothetical protein [Fluviicola sp.]
MFRRLAFLVLLLIPFSGRSQDSAKYSLGADFNYHPQGFFFHVRGQLIQKHLTHEVFLGFGITNTILQGQLRPALGYDISYPSKLIDWITISPFIRLSYSLLNTKVPEKHPLIHTTESFLACRLAFGKRSKIALAGGIGPAIEWKYDAYLAKRNHFFMWNYFAEIAYYYEF